MISRQTFAISAAYILGLAVVLSFKAVSTAYQIELNPLFAFIVVAGIGVALPVAYLTIITIEISSRAKTRIGPLLLLGIAPLFSAAASRFELLGIWVVVACSFVLLAGYELRGRAIDTGRRSDKREQL